MTIRNSRTECKNNQKYYPGNNFHCEFKTLSSTWFPRYVCTCRQVVSFLRRSTCSQMSPPSVFSLQTSDVEIIYSGNCVCKSPLVPANVIKIHNNFKARNNRYFRLKNSL